ncbi:MAG TPA: S53 family peptidase [Ktedonobacterales bacterium]|nr:S53 family peptidase [Ktedonobacterales bacterium]
MTRAFRLTLICLFVLLMFAASVSPSQTRASPTRGRARTPPTPTATRLVPTPTPAELHPAVYAPQQYRAAYGIQPLLDQGHDGTGQTIVLIESYGAPNIQGIVDTYDQQYGLPPVSVRVLAPLGTVPFDPNNDEMVRWADETVLDVEMAHVVAPGAGIVVLTSPVDETEGTAGLPEFLQLEQYAVAQHLGNIISQSWGASEYTLTDAAGRQEIAIWDSFYKTATTQDHITFFASTGDNGATDFTDASTTQLVNKPTIGFPADDPWVTACGGTSLLTNGSQYGQVAWSGSNGGFSAFYSEPAYQQTLPTGYQAQFDGKRGVPDVSSDSDPFTGLLLNSPFSDSPAGGTSAAAPFWAGLAAIANQMAGHPLGFLNPALYKVEASAAASSNFSDITQGNNSVHDKGSNVRGYSAVPGWDAVTGLGAPNAVQLLPDLVRAAA